MGNISETAAIVPAASADELARLDDQVAAFVATFVSGDVGSASFQQALQAVNHIGELEFNASGALAQRMLQRPERAQAGLKQSGGVSKSLGDLRRVIEDLDPAQSKLDVPRRILGLIPFGSKVRSYFDRYKSSQSQIDAIVEHLGRGKDELMRDNAAIDIEQSDMSATSEKLRLAVFLCERIDQEIESRTAELAVNDPDRARILRDDVLLVARQRRVDLLTQVAVNVQGHHVLDILRRNNRELIKGVERATNTTISALRTAVTASQALAGQKLVLHQITALNDTTGSMIESTSQLLASQGAEIHALAAGTSIGIEHLQAAFDNIYQALDAVDSYKQKAVTELATSASTLQTLIGTADQKLRLQ